MFTSLRSLVSLSPYSESPEQRLQVGDTQSDSCHLFCYLLISFQQMEVHLYSGRNKKKINTFYTIVKMHDCMKP